MLESFVLVYSNTKKKDIAWHFHISREQIEIIVLVLGDNAWSKDQLLKKRKIQSNKNAQIFKDSQNTYEKE